MTTPTVFISYSHKDEKWKDRLVPHLRSLKQAGVPMEDWDDRKIDGGDRWYSKIDEAMANAAVAILLISPHFLSSTFCVQEEVPALLKRQEESGMLLIPVLLKPCPWQAHRWLKDRQMLPRDGKNVAIDFAGDNADVVFADVAQQVFAHFKPLGMERLGMDRKSATVIVPRQVDLTHLPETGKELFGRDDELALLDRAWVSSEQVNAVPVRVLAFTAHGGVGKSTLVNHWLAELKRDNYRGAARVFGWSFYSQGAREEAAASADTFIFEALKFFGDEAMASSAASPWDKGERLARLVGGQRALLVLDGMEPLQSAHAFERGKLRDPALESLLRGLARQSAGLCLITTREPIPDLARRPGVTTRDLEQITPQAGRALMRTARVVATDAELEALANRFGPHALAISLLGVYLYEQPGHGIGPAQSLEQQPGATPIDRVLAGFEQWLGDSPEREALRLLAFFDRPADAGCLRALRKAPAIPGLTDRLTAGDDVLWGGVLDRLAKLRLIHVQLSKSGQRYVDAHPLIREHFAQSLKGGDPWRAAHRRLYEHLCATTLDKPHPTIEDLQPLYQAVAHGCQAGLQQDACDKVYYTRILRGQKGYSAKKLGAFGADLGAVACFFDTPWSRVSPALTEANQSWLRSEAAYRLQALGRLIEALEPMRGALEIDLKQENSREVAISYSNLSELELTLGEVAGAVRDAEQSVTYADRSGNALQGMGNRTTQANALHQAGCRAAAETLFREAEQMQAQCQPAYPLLYSRAGFSYCDLLVAAPERAAWQIQIRNLRPQEAQPEVKRNGAENAEESQSLPTPAACVERVDEGRAISQRAEKTLRWAKQASDWPLLDIARDHLTLGRAALYSAILGSSDGQSGHSQSPHRSDHPSDGFAAARRELDSAVTGLRQTGTQDLLPGALLTCAWLRFLAGARTGPESAQSDLNEALEIAERGPMKLFMADIHLYRARLFFGETSYPWESPAADLAAAEALINSCGYHRRDEELADAKRAILGS